MGVIVGPAAATRGIGKREGDERSFAVVVLVEGREGKEEGFRGMCGFRFYWGYRCCD